MSLRAPTPTLRPPLAQERLHSTTACWPYAAELMQGTFGVDVLACPRCGGRLRLIALIEQASVIQRVSRHLRLPTELPEPRPARAPPRLLERIENQSQDTPEFDADW